MKPLGWSLLVMGLVGIAYAAASVAHPVDGYAEPALVDELSGNAAAANATERVHQ